MLFTLNRYIFRELFKVFILALVALTLILSLGSILQPVQEYGAGPRQVIFLMFCFLPITLTFVLPMAALFAGALVYGRFTGDNELDACRASGISILTLVQPGLLLAVFVAVTNLILSFYVMPTFVHLAEKSLKADAKQMLFRNIQRKGFYKLSYDKYVILIYADHVDPINDTLSGVVVMEVKDNEIKQIDTIEKARIKFAAHGSSNEVQITAQKSSQMGDSHETGAESFSATWEFGSILGDEIKFKKIDQMRRIKNNLMLFEPIAQQARETYAQLTLELLAQDINSRISRSGEPNEVHLTAPDDANIFYELKGEPNSVRFTTTQCFAQDEKVNLSGDTLIIEYNTENKQTLRTIKCEEASLSFEGDRLKPELEMDIRNASIQETNQLKMRHIIDGLLLPDSIEAITRQFKTENGSLNVEKLAHELTSLSRLQPSPTLNNLQKNLQREIQKTLVEIKAEIHSRLVFGIGCVSMILIGIGLGIIKRGGHMLSAFGVSCVPAVSLIVCIMSGKQLTENLGAQTVSGVAIMWAGLVFLSLLAVGIYYKLLKN
jgi:lipopolysaccharide export LptBFGC system permease protein LptF